MRRLLSVMLCCIMMVSLCACGDSANADSRIIVSTAKELEEALENAKPGDSILLKKGVYEGHFYCQASGTKEAPITIAPCKGAKATITIPENSDGAGIHVNGCHDIIIRDLTFADMRSVEAYGILMTGGEENITIKDCEFRNIETTAPGTLYDAGGGANAILLFGESEDTISHVTIEGNVVHDNINGWSENISVASNCEYIYVNNNKVYDCTNIGIDFYGNAEYCEIMDLDQPRHCECKGNVVYNCNSFYAANAGIYVDGSMDILIEGNETYNNFYGIEIGSEEWRDYYSDEKRVQDITVKNNNIHDNTECGIRIGGWTNDEETGIVYNCLISGNKFKNNMAEILLAKCDTIRFENNTFADGMTIDQAIVHDYEISESKITNIIY